MAVAGPAMSGQLAPR